LALNTFSKAQTNSNNKLLYQIKINETAIYNDPREKYVFSNKGIGNWILNFYQKYITEHISGDCIYHPSCSRYCRKMIAKKGLFIGILATGDRLIRCSAFSAKDIPYYKFDENGYVTEDLD